MRTSLLIETLKAALAIYGDMPVKLMSSETCDWHPIGSVIKLHPYTGPNGCMNRSQPVDCLGITKYQNNAEDLVLCTMKKPKQGE